MSSFERGDVVWSAHNFGNRPFLIVSDDSHPFHGEEYIAIGITTTERTEAIPIPDDAWHTGSLPRESYISPWFVVSLKHANIERGVGRLRIPQIQAAINQLTEYIDTSVSFSKSG